MKRFVRLSLAELREVLETMDLAGGRIDGARFSYTNMGRACDPEVVSEVEAGRQHLANARAALRQLLRDNNV